MTKAQAVTATEELRKLSKDDEAFMDLIAIGITASTYPPFKAFLAARAKGKKDATA